MRHLQSVHLLAALGLLLPTTAAAGEIPWSAAQTLGSGTSPSGVAIADVDHDGDLDVAAAYASSDGLVGYIDTNGTFAASTLYAPGDSFTHVQFLDINLDGGTDAVLGLTNGFWAIASNDGAGTFTSGTSGLGGADAVTVFDADLDGDYDLYSCTTVQVSPGWTGLFQHGSDGTYPGGNLLLDGATDNYFDVSHGDFDRDGDGDLIFISDTPTTRVLFNTRGDADDLNGDWTTSTNLTDLDGAQDLAVGDIDGVNGPDIVISSNGGSGDAIVWYANDGDGLFGAPQTISAGTSDINELRLVDIDFDGSLDVVVARATGVDVFHGDGGTTWTLRSVAALTDAVDVAVGDVDDDGDLDIASASSTGGNVVWFENQLVHGTISFSTTANDVMTGIGNSKSSHMVDLDMDGDLDALGMDGSAGTAFYSLDLTGDGTTWGPAVTFAAGINQPQETQAADMDNDGDLDAITVGNLSGTPHQWFPNQFRDPGTLGTAESITNQSTTRQAVYVDFDQDGDLDQVRGQNNGGDVKLDLNNGDGTGWTTCTVFNGGSGINMNDVAVGDLDGDGDLDILGGRNGGTSPGLRWYQHTPGSGCSSSYTEIAITSIALGQETSGNSAMVIADIDGDGDLDIVAKGDSTLRWYDNPGSPGNVAGNWSDNAIAGNTGGRNTVVDIDRDGDLDVVTTISSTLVAYLNSNAGTTWTQVDVSASSAANAQMYDVNRDGLLDTYYSNGSEYEWRATATQQVSANTTDVSPTLGVMETTGDAVLSITVDHTFGRAGDLDVELGTVDLFLHDGAGVALSDADAGTLFDSIEIYRDDGNGAFDGADTLVDTVSSFTLAAGVLSIDVTNGVAGGSVAQGSVGEYLVVANISGVAIANSLTSFGLDHLASAGTLVDHADTDVPVALDGSPSGLAGVSVTVLALDSDGDGDPDTSDCNDLNAGIYTGATETCDGVDEDCNGTIDNGFDGDGDGAFNGSVTDCVTQYGAANVDCNDSASAINPSATEICDAIDNNCDSSTDEGFNVDADAFTACGADGISGNADDDCDDSDNTVYPGATESCDFVDSNCDDDLVDTFTNTDGDLLPDCIDTDDDDDGDPDSSDCNDTDDTIFTGATELCDNIDSDCNGSLVDTFTNSDTDSLPDCVDLDDDDDGMTDACEATWSFDPTDAADASLDGDSDGRSNLVECTDGTDPTNYDGPDAPVNTAPFDDEVVVTSAPSLEALNATSPLGDALSYTFEVYSDEALSALVTSVSAVSTGSGSTSWIVSPSLNDDDVVYWRAAASDAYVMGPWSEVTSFIVDTEGDGPTVPEPVFPVIGNTMQTGEEALEWLDSTSPEGLALEYDVRLYTSAAPNEPIASAVIVGDDSTEDEEWLIDIALVEETIYSWEVRSRDPAGRTSEFSDRQTFGYETANLPPTDPVFLSPVDDAQVGTTQPEFRINASVDPEGGPAEHLLEIDTSTSFDTADLLTFQPLPGAVGEVSTDLLVEGVELSENVTWYARVSARDIENQTSAPDIIEFFVRGGNEAPPVPELVRPLASEVTDVEPTLVVTTVADPEGDVVSYEFSWATAKGDVGASGTTSPTRELVAQGLTEGAGYWWAVRAIDAEGARSDWSEARYFVVVDPTWGSCSAVGAVGPRSGLLLLPLLVLLRRRRRVAQA
ncbi:MAG: VCBS repeat-containing protein [Deltaproteobacteria bacterium]|nr:VCBS repeat-containing protein [Deltaproteobacteria bacterium]